MTHLLGRQDCVESLRKDLIDLQGAVLDVFSRTGPVRVPSWKFPDKMSCNLDLVSLLEQYDFVDGEDEFNQHSHIVLLELIIDRLLLLVQSFNVHAEQLKNGHKKENAQNQCVSIGLVVRQYWNNVVHLCKSTSKDIQQETSSSTSHMSAKGDNTKQPSTIMSSGSRHDLNSASSDPTGRRRSTSSVHIPAISRDTRTVSCQTIQSALVPCDACARVQSCLRETGDTLVDMCLSEGLPSSLQRLLVAVDDTLQLGRLTASDVAQWSTEQCRDMGRLGKHLQEVRATVKPLKESLQASETELEAFRAQVEAAQEELGREVGKHQASVEQLEGRLKETQVAREEMEERLMMELEQLRKSTLSLEDRNSKLNAEVTLQQEKLQALEFERNGLQRAVQASQAEEESHSQLKERTQALESQLSSTQLLLDKEMAKYQSACRQQESLQGKQRSLLERVETLDQEMEELDIQLGDSEGRQADLQDQLKDVSQERDQLTTQLTQQQVLCTELQEQKKKLETRVSELEDHVTQLRGEVQDLSQRERLLVAFPELNPMPQGPPQSTGDVLGDMEQQFQANCVRIRILEQENAILDGSLGKLRDITQHSSAQTASSEHVWNHTPPMRNRPQVGPPYPTTPNTQASAMQTCPPGVLRSKVNRKRGDQTAGSSAGSTGMGPWDGASSTASSNSLSVNSLPCQTIRFDTETSAASTYTKIRQQHQHQSHSATRGRSNRTISQRRK